MSNKAWDDQLNRGSSSYQWENVKGQEKNYHKKTEDPEAHYYDEAIATFFDGVEFARRGNYIKAIPHIGCAFLLDSRSVRYIPILPKRLATAKRFSTLDAKLFAKLMDNDHGKISSGVMTIMMANFVMSNPKHGQTAIASALKAIETLLINIEENLEEMEGPGSIVHGGCLTRTNLLIKRSSFHMAMGNHKLAIKDLSQALKIDGKCTVARSSRACLWASKKLKDAKILHAEFKRVISEVHEDNRGNEVYYAFLAQTILNDPSLGTVQDAKRYFEKSRMATKRYDVIYGKRQKEALPPILKHVEMKFHMSPKERQEERDLMNVIKDLNNISMGGIKIVKDKYVCITCGAKEGEKGRDLLRCGKCKKVHYCCKECQVKDWKNHKQLCKTFQK
jgi:hypothetical protein